MSEPTKITVLVADDHPLVRESVRNLLSETGMTVVGEAADGQEAGELVGTLHPQVVVLDVAMPRVGGLEAARRIRDSWPETQLIMLSVHDEPRYIAQAERVGARAYIVKERLALDLVPAIQAACV